MAKIEADTLRDPDKTLGWVKGRVEKSGKGAQGLKRHPSGLGINECYLDDCRIPLEQDLVWTEVVWNTVRHLEQLRLERAVDDFDFGRLYDMGGKEIEDRIGIFITYPTRTETILSHARSRYWALITRPEERMSLPKLLATLSQPTKD